MTQETQETQETQDIDLTLANLLDGLAGEIRSPAGPGEFTKGFNETLIAEFRANGGVLAGELASSPFLLLTTTGAKSGRQRTTPLAYQTIEDRLLIIASRGGGPVSPAWYWNLITHPDVQVEIGAESFSASAVVVDEPERSRFYAVIASRVAAFADYERRTDRVIPVVELRRTSAT